MRQIGGGAERQWASVALVVVAVDVAVVVVVESAVVVGPRASQNLKK